MDTNVITAFEVLASVMRKMFACLGKFTADGCYTEDAGRAFVESGWPDGRPHTVQHRRVKARIVELLSDNA